MSMTWFVLITAMAVAALLGITFTAVGLRRARQQMDQSAQGTQRTAREQQEALNQLLAQQERIVQRLQHLEAIVTSEAWDALHDEASPAALHLPPTSPLDEAPSDPTAEHEARVAQLAQRVRG